MPSRTYPPQRLPIQPSIQRKHKDVLDGRHRLLYDFLLQVKCPADDSDGVSFQISTVFTGTGVHGDELFELCAAVDYSVVRA